MEDCSICLQPNNKIDISITKCNHKFHTSCLLKWRCNNSQLCPFCRTVLVNKENIPEQHRQYDILDRILDQPVSNHGYTGDDAFWANN